MPYPNKGLVSRNFTANHIKGHITADKQDDGLWSWGWCHMITEHRAGISDVSMHTFATADEALVAGELAFHAAVADGRVS